MSWLCDVCGYENEYSDETKNTSCQCCGEPAPEVKILKAQQELDEYHYELKRKAILEALKRKQEFAQQRINQVVTAIIHLIKAISIPAKVLVCVAFVWVAISMYANNMTFPIWEKQMNTNVKAVAVLKKPRIFEENLNSIDIAKKTTIAIQNKKYLAGNQIAKLSFVYTKIFTRMGNKKQDSLFLNFNNKTENVQLIIGHISDGFKIAYNNMRVIFRNFTATNINLKRNWPIFWTRAQNNINVLAIKLRKRVG